MVLFAFVLALASQLSLRSQISISMPLGTDLPQAPGTNTLLGASFGDPIPVAKLLMLYIQTFDYQSTNRTPYQALDYNRLQGWLSQILKLDPFGQYPLMAAAGLYAEVSDETKKRQMLEFVYQEFFKDPARRWQWLAHAAAVAKHGLKDLPLARKYAAAIQQHATGDDVPLWAKQMEIFILEDMNELEAAKIMIGGYLDKGLIKNPGEMRFLENRLKEIEARMKVKK